MTLIGHDICSLPVVGAGGLTVLFNQSFLARFLSQNTQIGYVFGNSGTVTGNILVIFYNGIVNSQLSLTDTDIFNGYLLPSTNQLGGACFTIISTLCQICPFSSKKELPVWTPVSLNNVYLVVDLHIVWHLRLHMSNMEEDSISISLNFVELDQLPCYLKE